MRKQSRIAVLMAIVLIVSLVLSACQSAPAPNAPTGKAEEKAKTEVQAKPVEKASSGAPATTAAKEPYKVGVLSILSGPTAGPGLVFRDTVVLEVESINAAGGIDGHPIELIIEDDGGDPTKAATALTKLIRQDKVLAIIGSIYSGIEASTRAVTEREQVLQIVGNPTNADIRSKNYRWSFNVSANEIIAAGKMVDIVKSKGYKKVAAIAESGPLYQAVFDTFKADASREGIEVLAIPDTMNIKDVDVTPQIGKLKELAAKEKPQALVLAASMTSIPAVKAMKQLGVEMQVIGMHNIAAPFFIQLAGDAFNGMLLPGAKVYGPESLPDSDPDKAMILDFDKRYKARYGKDHQGLWAPAYDATHILANALKVAGPDREKIRDAIEKTTKFVGAGGVFSFTPNNHEGLTKESLVVFEIKDKKAVLVGGIK